MSVLKEVEDLVLWLSTRQEVNTLMVLEPLQRVLKELYHDAEASRERFMNLKEKLRLDYYEIWDVKPYLGWETAELEKRIAEGQMYPERVAEAKRKRELKSLDSKKSGWNKK